MHETRIIRPANPAMPPIVPFDQWTDGICPGYPVAMAPRPVGKTPQHVVRMDDETWAEYGLACEALGISRSDDLRMRAKERIAEWKRNQRREAAAIAKAADN
jgi:hypothetical protein